MKKVKNALVSVWNKEGIVEFCRNLKELGITIISTGGTASLLRANGIEVKEVQDVTGFPELMNGRVKTLHPAIHAGILARRDHSGDLRSLRKLGIDTIDMVVVNLYPFKEMSRKISSIKRLMEYVDIGGPTIIRAAAKNYSDVIVVTDPKDYGWIAEALRKGNISLKTREELALKAFKTTAEYDAYISTFFATRINKRDKIPSPYILVLEKKLSLRYGENPHQQAGYFLKAGEELPFEQLHGKELSYNNLLDMTAAIMLAQEFKEPTAVIVKHTNPCGVACDTKKLASAYLKAFETDPLSAFGGIVAFNRKVDVETAKLMVQTFLEVIVAPSFSKEALSILTTKKNLRLIKLKKAWRELFEMRSVYGGYLVQERDTKVLLPSKLKVVTKKKPTKSEMKSLIFAWKVCKHVKSNAIVLAKGTQTMGIGAGQMSRVDSARFSVLKGRHPLDGCVAASDAFFPFPDGVETLADAGITAIIQPGGSIRDKEVIEAANRKKIAMVFTEMRHFKH